MWYCFFGPGFHSSTTAFNKEWTLLKSLSLSLLIDQIPGDFQPLEDSAYNSTWLYRYWIDTCWVNAHLAPAVLESEVLEVGDCSKEADKNARIRAFASYSSQATGVKWNGPLVSLYHVSLPHLLCTSRLSTLYLMKIIKSHTAWEMRVTRIWLESYFGLIKLTNHWSMMIGPGGLRSQLRSHSDPSEGSKWLPDGKKLSEWCLSVVYFFW